MAKKPIRLEADVVIAGSGPCGASIARDLSKKGKKVIVLEKGPWVKKLGNPLAFAKAVENRGQLKTVENDGSVVFSAKCVGGGSLVYTGACAEPNIEMWKKYGIDITQEIAETKKDCRVNKVPDNLVAPGVKRMMAAAQELGYPWQRLDRFFDPAKCKFGCGRCNFGCAQGAKWTAVEFIRDAEEHGATVLPNVTVRDAIVENGMAGGMRARGKGGQDYEVYAKIAVSSAGGMGSARIMQRSGISEAGRSFLGDPTLPIMGFVKEGVGGKGELGIDTGWFDEEHGVFFANAYGIRLTYWVQMLQSKHLRDLFHFGRGMQVMCKIGDDFAGRVFLQEGKISKKYTEKDLLRFDYARVMAEKILVKAGCDPYHIIPGQIVMGHPGGTVRVGTLLDSNLQTSIKNLYCCDSSVVPEDLGRPPMLTLVSIAKRQAKILDKILSGK
ncbi:MAG: FAD-dependent oxidoreductase [Dehalococcoidia bacterium]|nr:FAD-dependent oxidoreductase [Dehalococcoidia bacterium]